MPKGWCAKAGLPRRSRGMIPKATHLNGRWQAWIEKFKSRSSSVEGLAGVLTDDSHGDASQLRDSDGLSPFFPRFHQQLVTAETRGLTLRAAHPFAMNASHAWAQALRSFITYGCVMHRRLVLLRAEAGSIPETPLAPCCEFRATLSC